LSQRTGISLDWLLLGDGPELRGASGPPEAFAEKLRATVVAEVASGEQVNRAEVDAVLPAAPMLMQEFILRQRLTLRELRERASEFRRRVLRAVGERLAARPAERRESLQPIPLAEDSTRQLYELENRSRLSQLERLVTRS
jgi:hypothetical protein